MLFGHYCRLYYFYARDNFAIVSAEHVLHTFCNDIFFHSLSKTLGILVNCCLTILIELDLEECQILLYF